MEWQVVLHEDDYEVSDDTFTRSRPHTSGLEDIDEEEDDVYAHASISQHSLFVSASKSGYFSQPQLDILKEYISNTLNSENSFEMYWLRVDSLLQDIFQILEKQLNQGSDGYFVISKKLCEVWIDHRWKTIFFGVRAENPNQALILFGNNLALVNKDRCTFMCTALSKTSKHVTVTWNHGENEKIPLQSKTIPTVQSIFPNTEQQLHKAKKLLDTFLTQSKANSFALFYHLVMELWNNPLLTILRCLPKCATQFSHQEERISQLFKIFYEEQLLPKQILVISLAFLLGRPPISIQTYFETQFKISTSKLATNNTKIETKTYQEYKKRSKEELYKMKNELESKLQEAKKSKLIKANWKQMYHMTTMAIFTILWQQPLPSITVDDISLGVSPIPISAVNEIDYDWYPFSIYAAESYYEARLDELRDTFEFSAHCFCENSDCTSIDCECQKLNQEELQDGTPCAYVDGRLTRFDDHIIYECNSKCPCGEDCKNKVLQRGTQVKLQLFKTKNRGWGVKAKEFIKTGTFIIEYVGEIISDETASTRNPTYLFDLNKNQNHYTLDPEKYSNVARFLNHSHSPNLVAMQVCVESHDVRLTRIGLFACKDIAAEEELVFNYNYPIQHEMLCYCGAPNCTGWLR